MKLISAITLMFCMIASISVAGVLCYQVQVDQDTKLYVGTDTSNYLTIPAGTEYGGVKNTTQIVFKIASSAKTSTPNVRIGFQTSQELSRDSTGQKLQGCAINFISDYYLTKSTTVVLN